MAFNTSNAFGIGRYVQREVDANGRFVYENSALNVYGLGDLLLYFNQTNQTWMVCLKIELLSIKFLRSYDVVLLKCSLISSSFRFILSRRTRMTQLVSEHVALILHTCIMRVAVNVCRGQTKYTNGGSLIFRKENTFKIRL